MLNKPGNTNRLTAMARTGVRALASWVAVRSDGGGAMVVGAVGAVAGSVMPGRDVEDVAAD